jgi:hypothetical protein
MESAFLPPPSFIRVPKEAVVWGLVEGFKHRQVWRGRTREAVEAEVSGRRDRSDRRSTKENGRWT